MIFFLSLALLSVSAHAGDLVADCDTVAASRDTCLSWAQSSAVRLGCSVVQTTVGKACQIHPWGSDFIKSWVCTVSSPDCDPFVHDQKTCPEGFEHLFKGGWDACKKKDRGQQIQRRLSPYDGDAHGGSDDLPGEHFRLRKTGRISRESFGALPKRRIFASRSKSRASPMPAMTSPRNAHPAADS